MILSKVLSIRNTFIKSKLHNTVKQVWNLSPLAPHFSPLSRFFVFAMFFFTLLIFSGLSFYTLFWHARCIILIERRNELNGSGRVH